jgi:hypothetical protein
MGPTRLFGKHSGKNAKLGTTVWNLFQISFIILDIGDKKKTICFLDFLGDHFARVESSGDQNLTMFILYFHVFPIFDRPKKS